MVCEEKPTIKKIKEKGLRNQRGTKRKKEKFNKKNYNSYIQVMFIGNLFYK